MTTVYRPGSAGTGIDADADTAVGDLLVERAYDVSTRCAAKLRRLAAQLGEADLVDGERRRLAVAAADLQEALAIFSDHRRRRRRTRRGAGAGGRRRRRAPARREAGRAGRRPAGR
ncbi:hypothetical protein [Nonomuraea typhae]|uniref:hypothetical protein n=1 Tax=Nonomuraea typhae TaxID=2603600 RepID=UPI0012F881A3|nr:hypothetical protein [Nonomuraea typhae]